MTGDAGHYFLKLRNRQQPCLPTSTVVPVYSQNLSTADLMRRIDKNMNLEYFIERLSTNRQVISGLATTVSVEQARWKPSPEKWSILEVLNHLYDEEREDFRQRLDLVLTNPEGTWPRIDPQNWVTSRCYQERDLGASLKAFLSERERSLSWLSLLAKPNWQNRYVHPDGRVITAGDLLASWLAHDYLHVRQLARLHWQYVGVISQPYQTTYGGPWKES